MKSSETLPVGSQFLKQSCCWKSMFWHVDKLIILQRTPADGQANTSKQQL